MGEFSHMLKPKRIDFKYGAGFPLKEIQVDVDKVSAIYSITEAFAFSILSGDAKVLDETVRNELNVLGVEKFEQLYRVWSEFSLIVSAIREAENLAQAVKEWRKSKDSAKIEAVFAEDEDKWPMRHIDELLARECYIFSRSRKTPESKWYVLRNVVEVFNATMGRWLRDEWCYLLSPNMRGVAAAFFAYKDLCDKFGDLRLGNTTASVGFCDECKRMRELFSLAVRDFVSELRENVPTLSLLKKAHRRKDILSKNWPEYPISWSDGRNLLTNKQLANTLLGVAEGLFNKYGTQRMLNTPWMARHIVCNSALWLCEYIYRALPSFSGGSTIELPISEHLKKEGHELVDDIANLCRFAQLDMFPLESDVRSFVGISISSLRRALEDVAHAVCADEKNAVIDAVFNVNEYLDLFFGYFDHRLEWGSGFAKLTAEAMRRKGREAFDLLLKSVYRAELKASEMHKIDAKPVRQKRGEKGFTVVSSCHITDLRYNEILSMIRHAGATMEQQVETYKNLGEEKLRNVLLTSLNTTLKGAATGETFRHEGKTDVRIEDENRAAFVAECKMWMGESLVEKAFDQLGRYLTWRDDKVALIYFVRRKGFVAVLKKMEQTLRQISGVNVDKMGDNEFACVCHLKEHEGMEIRVRIMMFDLYCKE